MLVGVDLGTTGLKAAIYAADGTALAEQTTATPLRWHGTGRVDQDPEGFYRAASATIAACLRSAGADARDVRAIAICGQMAGTMGVDADFAPTTPYDSWLDLRCAEEVDWLERELGDTLVETCGCPPMVNHAPKILWWKRREPEAFERTVAWIPPGAYLAGRLAGLRGADAFIDTTYLHFTGLADQRAGTWSERLADALEVPLERLPRIVEPTEVIGELDGAGRRRHRAGGGHADRRGAGGHGGGDARRRRRAPGPAAGHRRDRRDPRRQRGRVPPRRGRAHADHDARRGRGPVGVARLPVGRPAARLAGRAAAGRGVRRARRGGRRRRVRSRPRAPGRRGRGDPRRLGRPRVPAVPRRPDPPQRAVDARGMARAAPPPRPRASRPRGARRRGDGVPALPRRPHRSASGPRVRRDARRGRRSAQRDLEPAEGLGPRRPLRCGSGGASCPCWGAALVAGAAVGVFDDLAAAAEAAAPHAGRIEPDTADHAVYARLHAVHRGFEDAVVAPYRALDRLFAPSPEVPA